MTALDLSLCYRDLGFSDAPFRITPDLDFFFPGSHHQAALEHLRYGLLSGGFTVLTGEVGLGKTLLCRLLLKYPPKGVRTVYLFNPPESSSELLQAIHLDLTGHSLKGDSVGSLSQEISRTLLRLAEQGERTAVIVDEAHRLSPELLEGLRLLSNLETEKEKLLHLLLVGQPELDRTLSMPCMRPLAQRISVYYRLLPFRRGETAAYIRHRLWMAGGRRGVRFRGAALAMAHIFSKGVPRRINQICDRALLAAFSAGRPEIGMRMVWRATREVHGVNGGY